MTLTSVTVREGVNDLSNNGMAYAAKFPDARKSSTSNPFVKNADGTKNLGFTFVSANGELYMIFSDDYFTNNYEEPTAPFSLRKVETVDGTIMYLTIWNRVIDPNLAVSAFTDLSL